MLGDLPRFRNSEDLGIAFVNFDRNPPLCPTRSKIRFHELLNQTVVDTNSGKGDTSRAVLPNRYLKPTLSTAALLMDCSWLRWEMATLIAKV